LESPLNLMENTRWANIISMFGRVVDILHLRISSYIYYNNNTKYHRRTFAMKTETTKLFQQPNSKRNYCCLLSGLPILKLRVLLIELITIYSVFLFSFLFVFICCNHNNYNDLYLIRTTACISIK